MGFNAKLFEIVLYADSFDLNSLKPLLDHRSGVRNYAFILHDQCLGKDGSLLKKHVHVMLRMNNGCNSDNVAKWFNASPGQVERCKGRWADMLAYLTHANASDKFQYDPASVVSNFDWLSESKKAGTQRGDARLNELLDGIDAGLIRRYNIYDHMTIQDWAKYKTRLTSGFDYREKKLKGADREMESYYVHGESGTGKTTWAKTYASLRGYSTFISSGSNDILDGYEGQDCIILDDLRPSCLGLSDLLKMLDPRTASAVKSRYYNKTLECKLIIITTTLPMEAFFSQVFENETEPLKQLERRCQRVLKFTHDKMFLKVYDKKLGRYIHSDPYPNTILASMNVEHLTEEDVAKMESDMFMASQSEIQKMRKANTPDSNRAADLIEHGLKVLDIKDRTKDAVPSLIHKDTNTTKT